IGVLVLRNFVTEGVSQIGHDDKEQKPKTCGVLPESAPQPGKGQNKGQRKQRRSEFAQEHSAKFNKLRSHHRWAEGEEHAVLAAGYMPPNLLQRTRIAPVDYGGTRRRKRQKGINGDQAADRNQCGIQQPAAGKKFQPLGPVNENGQSRENQPHGHVVNSQSQAKYESGGIKPTVVDRNR